MSGSNIVSFLFVFCESDVDDSISDAFIGERLFTQDILDVVTIEQVLQFPMAVLVPV